MTRFNQLPLVAEGWMELRPEPSHMDVILANALAWGDGQTYVEDGPTNGAMTLLFTDILAVQPNSRLYIIGTPEDFSNIVELISRTTVADRVTWGRPDVRPTAYFIGCPTDVRLAVGTALALESRVIMLYDVCTAKVFNLKRFEPQAEAAELLATLPDRRWLVLDRQDGMSVHPRRGMGVSEALSWAPGELTPNALAAADNFSSLRADRQREEEQQEPLPQKEEGLPDPPPEIRPPIDQQEVRDLWAQPPGTVIVDPRNPEVQITIQGHLIAEEGFIPLPAAPPEVVGTAVGKPDSTPTAPPPVERPTDITDKPRVKPAQFKRGHGHKGNSR